MMQLKVKSAAEIAQLASQKLLSRHGGRETTVFLPPTTLPPSRAYKWEEYETPLGKIKIFAFPSERGGWVVKVRFNTAITFNSPISPEQGKELLERLKKQVQK